jgi:hypothetical protein
MNSLTWGKFFFFFLCFWLLHMFPFDYVFVSLLIIVVARKKVSIEPSRYFSLHVFLFWAPLILCALALSVPTPCAICFGHYSLCVLYYIFCSRCSLLCVLVLHFGLPCSMNSCFRHSLSCALALSILQSMCYCFGHSSFCVFLLLVLFVVLRAIGGSCWSRWSICY